MEMEERDPWMGKDKLYHILFCFTLSLLFTTLASFAPHPFLRRHAVFIGSIASLLAGAAKEAADHLGYFQSSGASFRDAVADIVGVFIALFVLSLCRFSRRHDPIGVSMV